MMYGWDDESWWMLGIGALLSLALAIALMTLVLWVVHRENSRQR